MNDWLQFGDTAPLPTDLPTLGMAAGTQKFTTAVLGTLFAAFILVFIWFTNFGARQRYDLILNLRWALPLSQLADLQQFLKRHSLKTILASQRSGGDMDATHLSYRLRLRDPERVDLMLDEIRQVDGVSDVSSLRADHAKRQPGAERPVRPGTRRD